MGILIECPKCRTRGSVKRTTCKCGHNTKKSDHKCYWIEYYEAGRRTRERVGHSKLAAENRLREIQTAKAEGRHVRKNKNTQKLLGELYRWYMELPEVKGLASYDTLTGRLGHPVRVLGEKTRVAELSLDRIRQYTDTRSQESSSWAKQDCIAPATIRKEIASLKAMLNVAKRYGKIDSNPIKDAPMPKVENTRMVGISYEDFQRLLDCADEHIRPVLIMAYYEPMRRDEITRLTWNEVEMKAGFIRLAAKRTKGNHAGRSIPIHPEVHKMLKSLPRSLQTNRVFLRMVKGQLKPFDEFKHAWVTARKEAGLDHIVFHDFRHVAISNLRKAGNSPTVIMKASGHKTMSMFLRYNLVDEEDLKGMRWLKETSEESTQKLSG